MATSAPPIVLGITGASGAPYAVRLLRVLLKAEHSVHLSISPSAVEVMERELERTINLDHFQLSDLLGEPLDAELSERLQYHHFRNFQAGIASGSFLTSGMIICPCSMGTVAAIAHGLSQNLIHRAADVHLKERRRLLLVPRETPMSVIHLRNLLACTEAGAVVLPAMPAFYTKPQTIDDMINFVVGRICDQFGIDHSLLDRWGTEKER